MAAAAAAKEISTVSPFIDAERQEEHRSRNLLHSMLLIGGMATITLTCFSLVWGWKGALVALLAVAFLLAFAPRVPPEAIMRMYRARQIDPLYGGDLVRVLDVIADRAELPARPLLYVIPSTTLNAFATGTRERAAVALTEGLLRRLSLRETAGVMAHELSHIRNNDLLVMGLADVMSRLTQLFSLMAMVLAALNVIVWLAGGETIPWLAIALLYLAPAVSSLLQLGLSRTREYDADLEAAMLTGDPLGLASALRQLERYQGRFWEDLMLPMPGRRVPQPSLLRTHPETEDRIARLQELSRRPGLPPIVLVEQPMMTLVGFGPAGMTPRQRWTGLWY